MNISSDSKKDRRHDAKIQNRMKLLREKHACERIREAEEDIRLGRVYTGDLQKLLKNFPKG